MLLLAKVTLLPHLCRLLSKVGKDQTPFQREETCKEIKYCNFLFLQLPVGGKRKSEASLEKFIQVSGLNGKCSGIKPVEHTAILDRSQVLLGQEEICSKVQY